MSGELPFTGFVIPGGGGGGSGDVTGGGTGQADNLASWTDTTSIEDSGIAKADVVLNTGTSTDNAAARYDSTTGSLVQDSAFIIGDVSGASLPISTTAGNALAISVTAPAAANGASQAGKNFSVTASNAVASLDTAGAAAGGSVTITAGNAARLTSGNAAGGNINLTPGTGIGTGANGSVVFPAGSSGSPAIVVTSAQSLFSGASNHLSWGRAGNIFGSLTDRAIHLPSDGGLRLVSTTNAATGTADVGISRVAAGILKTDNGSSGVGWVLSPSHVALTSDFTNDTATMSNLTGLTVTLLTGRKYTFRMVLLCANSVAADGVKIDFDGGAGTATVFRQHTTIHDAALLTSAQTSALATDVTAGTITGDSIVESRGAFTVNAAGTFIPRAAMNADTTGTLTVYAGSYLWIEDTTFA